MERKSRAIKEWRETDMMNRVSTEYYCRGCGYRYSEVKNFSERAKILGTSTIAFQRAPVDLLDRFAALKTRKQSERCSFNSKDGLCPVCGSKVVFVSSSILEEERVSIFDTETKRVSGEVEKFVQEAKEEAGQKYPAMQQNASADLKTYLQHLIAIETNIMSLSQRLVPMTLAQLQAKQTAVRVGHESKSEHIDKTREAVRQINQEILGLSSKYPILSEDVRPKEVGMIPPAKPTFKPYNIFNKRKIEKENELAQREYEIRLSEFNKEFEQKKEAEIQKRRAANAENQVKADQEREILSARIQELENAPVELSPESKTAGELQEKCSAEIAEMKQKIRELCDARARFHSCGIVYPKYLNFVAITTIYEYLITGRCTELTGGDGAYNLYESEIRANRVIAQLDQVVNSLEKIKENQYLTYTVLKEMREGNDKLSEQLGAIAKTTGRIEENSAFIAYNTGKIAHYTKVNAELTNALGFLVALK